jgi:hypothetical protein
VVNRNLQYEGVGKQIAWAMLNPGARNLKKNAIQKNCAEQFINPGA